MIYNSTTSIIGVVFACVLSGWPLVLGYTGNKMCTWIVLGSTAFLTLYFECTGILFLSKM